MTKNETQETQVPEHLRHIKFQTWHFYVPKKSTTGQPLVTDDFVTEVMQQLGLTFKAEVTVHPYTEDKKLILARVDIMENNETKTPAYASITEMPHKQGQTHFAQLATTQALKTALRRHIGLSNHDTELITKAIGFNSKTIKTRETTDLEEETEDIEPVDDISLDLEI